MGCRKPSTVRRRQLRYRCAARTPRRKARLVAGNEFGMAGRKARQRRGVRWRNNVELPPSPKRHHAEVPGWAVGSHRPCEGGSSAIAAPRALQDAKRGSLRATNLAWREERRDSVVECGGETTWSYRLRRSDTMLKSLDG